MTTLGAVVRKVRAKNAGPFWVTIDIFCDDPAVFAHVCQHLPNSMVAERFALPPNEVRRFEIDSLNVLKFSLPRPATQGSRFDRDMHGAQWAIPLAELAIPEL